MKGEFQKYREELYNCADMIRHKLYSPSSKYYNYQGEVIDLLRNLQKQHQLAYLFISHDLKVVRAMSHRILVMYQGKVVEQGTAEQVFESPNHEYTKTLLRAATELC